MATERPSAAVQGGHETDVGDTTSLAAAGPPQTGVSATLQPHATQKKKQVCRFHNSKKGCKAGTNCPFVHADSSVPKILETKPRAAKPKPERGDGREIAIPSRQHELSVDRSKVVSRPVPKTEREDPRVFQLGQLRRRFAPTEEALRDATLLKLKLAPSDPDFPFDLPFLDCSLTIPLSYPKDKPSLRITNQEMPRGFQLNVERGFDQIILESPNATLLGIFNRFDKQLETLLSGEKADTVKIIRNAPSSEPQEQTRLGTKTSELQPVANARRSEPTPSFTSEQKSQAEKRRQADIRQLVARLGRLPGFVQSSDDVSFTIPFQPTKKTALPEALRNQKSIRLVVPQLYNLHTPRIEVNGNNDPAARALEQAFQERVKSETGLNLLAHINFLTQHAHTMSTPKEAGPLPEGQSKSVEAVRAEFVVPVPTQVSGVPVSENSDKPHIQVIPRPPEWNNDGPKGTDGPDGWSSDDSYSYDSGDETEGESSDKPEQQPAPTSGLAERGILLSFPNLELYGCELLELVSLSITVKCERCKDLLDVQRLRNNIKGDVTGMRDEICKKCANNLAVGFRADLIHQNSVRAGYLDLDGCTVVDMLPSNFIPTCSECSTSYPAPGVVGVRGDSILSICRECHRKMSFRIPETKFLHVSAAAVRASRAPARRKIKENLGIVAGQELPRRGRCTHYAKSYRWFRFSCCSKVYACDRCHDEKESHPNEHANRMICGYCSREQNYAPETCHFCRASMVARRGHGFWEGGKGTRDKTRMSRKDPRKYKRRPGTKVGGS
ncbi:hypothetical protein VTO58DRAFT_110669 [Aureobasidium pullulans]